MSDYYENCIWQLSSSLQAIADQIVAITTRNLEAKVVTAEV
jgi:hypothetical protein